MHRTASHRETPTPELGRGESALARLLTKRFSSLYLFALIAFALIASHFFLLRLPYFWDEAGYYVPAARDLMAGSLIPHSTPSNAHPPLVLAWLAASWKLFGFHPATTRCAMLLLAALSLLGFFRLAKTVSNVAVAGWATLLTAIYPVFFAQSSLAQVDLPAAGLIFWGLDSYLRKRSLACAAWLSAAVLAKETALLVPISLVVWEALSFLLDRKHRHEGESGDSEPSTFSGRVIFLLAPLIPLGTWYAFHYAHTGFVFGNPEFFRYNAQATLHPLRILLALLLRLWQVTVYMNLYLLTIACALAMRQSPIEEPNGPRLKIAVSVQLTFLTIAVIYVVAVSVIGGAILARYLLPIVPLVILICVSTVWRRLRMPNLVLGIVAAAFIAALFVNPPYGFAPEDNLAYRDFVLSHERAERWLQAKYPNARVLTAWPASGELTKPDVGYVSKPMRIVQIENFTQEQLVSAAEVNSEFDVALVFSTKYEAHSLLDGWPKWQEWKSRYFDFHRDMPPEIAAALLGGRVVYVDRQRGQWIAIILIERIEKA
jgi:Dolichyl-phosphate-mannose-protein mannosyltransferase